MLSYLTSVFQSLLKVFGMYKQRPNIVSIPDLPLEHTGVTQWCAASKASFVTQPEFRNYDVVEIVRYKKMRGAQHEYLVARVVHPIYGTKHLRIERVLDHVRENGHPILANNQRDEPTSEPPGGDISAGLWANWFPASSDTNTLQLNHSQPKPPQQGSSWPVPQSSKNYGSAKDVVHLWKPPILLCDTEVETLKFEDNPLPLVHLAILALAVHQKESLYNLLKHQCYWYANMIARVVAREKCAGASPAVIDPVDTDFCYETISGTFYRIKVHTVEPMVVTAIQEEFKSQCKAFGAEVCISCPLLHPTT